MISSQALLMSWTAHDIAPTTLSNDLLPPESMKWPVIIRRRSEGRDAKIFQFLRGHHLPLLAAHATISQ